MLLLYSPFKATRFASVPVLSPVRLPSLSYSSKPSTVQFQAFEVGDSPFKAFLIDECGFSWTELEPFPRGLEPFLNYKSADTPREAAQLLRDFGFSQDQVKTILLRSPTVFRLKAERQLRPKLELILSLGFNIEELQNVVTSSPRFLCYSLENTLKPHIEDLKEAFGSNDKLSRALKKDLQLLYAQKNFKTAVKLLKRWGIHGDRLHYVLEKAPFLLSRTTDILEAKLEFVKDLGFSDSSNLFLHALIAIGKIRVENCERRSRNLASLGFQPEEVKEILRKCPYIITTSLEKMRKNLCFMRTLGHEPSFVVRYPSLLSYSLEKNLKPRNEVIEYIRQVQPSKRVPGIITVSSLSEKRFLDRYVMRSPYASQLLKIYKDSLKSYSEQPK